MATWRERMKQTHRSRRIDVKLSESEYDQLKQIAIDEDASMTRIVSQITKRFLRSRREKNTTSKA